MKKILIKMMSALLFVVASFSAVSADDAWMRSYTLETAGQYAAAAQSIEHFLKEIPTNEFAVLRSAWLYYLAENYSRSIKYYQTALEINKNSIDAMLGMSLPLMAQGRWREAASMTQEVIKISKFNYLAHTRLMTCEDNLEQWETLEKHAETLIVYYPSDATILVYLARAYSHTNKGLKAKEVYQQVLQRYPGHLEASKFLSK
ncbi:MAG: tetratricopeptide repeat protein [Gammaproteobacteria bacterium]|nr:tetratricopeptide repeat protein [Gammaproteobacteria bacterium]